MEKLNGKELEVLEVLLVRKKWLSNTDIHKIVTGVAPRTIRLITRKLYRLRIIDRAEIVPCLRYMVTTKKARQLVGLLKRKKI